MRKAKPLATALAIVFPLASGVMPMSDAEAKSASSPISGIWGGPQIRLQADAHSTTIDLDCAHGRITGPIKLDKKQRFSVKGSYELYTPGPQQADVPVTASARYSGQVSGDTLTLDIVPASGAPKQSYTLTRGKMSKIIRCY